MVKKWKHLKGWQRGGIIGFSAIGTIHVFILTLDLIIEYSTRATAPTLGLIVLEFPLLTFHFKVIEPLFGNEFIPQSDFFLWVWAYLCGTIAWGVIAAAVGFILGFLSDLSKAKEVRK